MVLLQDHYYDTQLHLQKPILSYNYDGKKTTLSLAILFLFSCKKSNEIKVSNQSIQEIQKAAFEEIVNALSDHRPTFNANGNEWRTPPLWGIGLTQIVNGHNFFLHDGRARTMLEAILWHGGEGSYSADYVKSMNRADREALLAFLKSL